MIERTVTGARLDDRSTARCVRADVTAISLVKRSQGRGTPFHFDLTPPTSDHFVLSMSKVEVSGVTPSEKV